ncbi:MAG: F0F1 ATP synthase subunit epsilon [Clostridia bacterium]|nr:F0F1 ATP synthase subunit epsilon [Clostridia bacterium]
MSEKTLTFEVVTPVRKVLSKEITSLIVPAIEGYLGVLPNHAPLICGLEPGVVKYKEGNEYKKLAISGGFLEVSHNKATIIANAAELPEDIDVARAKAAKERAEKRLKQRTPDIDLARAEAALKRAMARLKVANDS